MILPVQQARSSVSLNCRHVRRRGLGYYSDSGGLLCATPDDYMMRTGVQPTLEQNSVSVCARTPGGCGGCVLLQNPANTFPDQFQGTYCCPSAARPAPGVSKPVSTVTGQQIDAGTGQPVAWATQYGPTPIQSNSAAIEAPTGSSSTITQLAGIPWWVWALGAGGAYLAFRGGR